MGNTWGHLFRVTTWGESHGAAIGAVVDGCPPRLPLSEADIQPDLDRRVPGQSALTSQRKETDTVKILSGVFEGVTLGTPISLQMPNLDQRPGDYREVMEKYRKSFSVPDVERTKMAKEVWKIALDELWIIPIVVNSPASQGVRVIKNTMGNVPERLWNSAVSDNPHIAHTETWYFKS